MNNNLFHIDNNGTITIKKRITQANGNETDSIENELLKGNFIYLYMNINSLYITNKQVNRPHNNTMWIKDLATIPVDKNSDKMIININKSLLHFFTKNEDGSTRYFSNNEAFLMYFQPKKFELCKPFRMEADGELLKYPKFLDESNSEIYYGIYNIDNNDNIKLPYTISSTNNENTSKSGLKLDVQVFNDMLEAPLEEGEFLYLTAIREKTKTGIYKNYLLPIYRSKDNSRKNNKLEGVTRTRELF